MAARCHAGGQQATGQLRPCIDHAIYTARVQHSRGFSPPSPSFDARTVTETKPKPKDFTSRLGPGLITGAADDDPSGIATYSQAGAQFRFALVWTLFLTMPLMIGIQMLSARIGFVTHEGLAANIGKMCPRWLTLGLVSLLVVANTINIAADIGAMAEAVKLLACGPQPLYVLGFGALCIGTQIYFSYERTVRSYEKYTCVAMQSAPKPNT